MCLYVCVYGCVGVCERADGGGQCVPTVVGLVGVCRLNIAQ